MRRYFPFPKWTNALRPAIAVAILGGPVYLIVLIAFGTSARTTAVGYQPNQPVPYSHALHAGTLGIDCRYCHTSVENAAMAAIPPTQTCMNCHQMIRTNAATLLPVRESFASGMPVEWTRVHDLPGYVYFNHSAHVRRGVGCVSCHGRVDRMEVVTQMQPLTMGWCLDCHRNPERALRPVEYVTKMDWVPPEDQETMGRRLREQYNIDPPTDCWTCHR
ncbi:MAG: cytochrome c3 family protein [Candidatus Eisenbacteria bacterium]|nr:cytochrome c3 family protein [Candidatus Eisenbacteria bacterium]